MQNHSKYNLQRVAERGHQLQVAHRVQPIHLSNRPQTEHRARLSQYGWINQLINKLPATEIDVLSTYGRKINLAAGQSVYHYGDPVEYFYFPETAVISQYQVLEDGRTCEIAMVGSEGAVGLSAISAKSKAVCWSETSVAGSALQVSREVFKRNLGNNSELHRKLQEFTNEYVRQISQRVICNYFHQVKERFCSWLLMVSERCRMNYFSFTQEVMARLLGVHRPSLTCIAQDLQQENLISYTRGKIKILDKGKLANQACACYTDY